MVFEEIPPVDKRTLLHVLARIRDIRQEAVDTMADHWAFRQAMITIMAIDTECALESGVDADTLFAFDDIAEEQAGELVQSLLEEVRASGR